MKKRKGEKKTGMIFFKKNDNYLWKRNDCTKKKKSLFCRALNIIYSSGKDFQGVLKP